MRIIIATGSAGLIGSETVKRFATEGRVLLGSTTICARNCFGAEASTKKTCNDLITKVRNYEHYDLDIRDASAVAELLKLYHRKIDAIVHTASQPSHDWAARDPQTDFTVNANGTLNLLEAPKIFLRKHHSFLLQQKVCGEHAEPAASARIIETLGNRTGR
jgi:CDP-paratose 2-epimerase